jgi:hypothetical protein
MKGKKGDQKKKRQTPEEFLPLSKTPFTRARNITKITKGKNYDLVQNKRNAQGVFYLKLVAPKHNVDSNHRNLKDFSNIDGRRNKEM